MFNRANGESDGLKLKDFVKETLLSIFDAVQEAGDEVRNDTGRKGVIAPIWGEVKNAQGNGQIIEFDVAVTVSAGKENAGNAGIRVISAIEFGKSSNRKSENSSISRVRFNVPVIMPSTVIQDEQPVPTEES
jgi:hypothetical protein